MFCGLAWPAAVLGHKSDGLCVAASAFVEEPLAVAAEFAGVVLGNSVGAVFAYDVENSVA